MSDVLIFAGSLVAVGIAFASRITYGRRAWSASTFSKRLEKVLEPPKVRSRVRRSPRSPITFCLDDSSKFLPFASYPCSGGLSNIARFYKPHMPLFTRHLEWEPTDKPEHRVLVSCVLRRATCIGSLHERYRALEKVFQQVMSENGNLVGEIQRLRELLDGGGQQEDILKMTLEREREMRKAVERERTAASRAKEEVEEENERLQQQILQLQNLLQQAVEFHSVNHGAPRSDSFYGYQQHQQQVGV